MSCLTCALLAHSANYAPDAPVCPQCQDEAVLGLTKELMVENDRLMGFHHSDIRGRDHFFYKVVAESAAGTELSEWYSNEDGPVVFAFARSLMGREIGRLKVGDVRMGRAELDNKRLNYVDFDGPTKGGAMTTAVREGGEL